MRAVTSGDAAIGRSQPGTAIQRWFNRGFDRFLEVYDALVGRASCVRPALRWCCLRLGFAASLLLFPRLGLAFFPRTDAGQFVINVKAPSGTRLVETEKEIARLEELIRRIDSRDATWR